MGKLLNFLQMSIGSKKKRKTPVSQITRHLSNTLTTYQLISDLGGTESQRQPIMLSLHSFVCIAALFWPFLYPSVPPAPAQKVVPWVKESTLPFVIHNLTVHPHTLSLNNNVRELWVFSPSPHSLHAPLAPQLLHQALPGSNLARPGRKGRILGSPVRDNRNPSMGCDEVQNKRVMIFSAAKANFTFNQHLSLEHLIH